MKTDALKVERKKKTVFIDRDGTLVEEVNFLSRTEDLRFFDDTDEAIRLLKENGFLVVVLTNQSGIGRGFFTEAAMHEIHAKIQTDLTDKIDAFYFCPHLPTGGCRCRKPNVGMIEAAERDYAIDLEKSWIIGDKAIDVETGFNARLKTALVLTGYGRKDVEKVIRKPDIVAETLLAVVEKILMSEPSAAADG